MKKIMTLSALAIIAASGSAALAQAPGDILFVSNNFSRTSGASPDTIGYIPAAGGAATTLFSQNGPDTRFRHVNRGPNGTYYFTDAEVSPPGMGTGNLFSVNNLFSGTGTRNTIASGGLLNGPLDLSWHAPSDSWLVVNNPSGTGVLDNPEDGITSVTLGGSTQQVFQEIGGEMPPRYDAGVDIVADPFNPGSYYVLTLNDGVGPGNSDGAPSVLHRLTVNSDFSTVSMDVVQDFSASATGLADPITFATGIDVDPVTGDVMLTSGNSDSSIFRVGIDGSGNSTGVSLFADIAAEQVGLGLDFGSVDEIEWDPFNNRWILAEFISFTEGAGLSRISAINADGTGYVELGTGYGVNDIIVIPTPGVASLLAVAGLGCLRRRR